MCVLEGIIFDKLALNELSVSWFLEDHFFLDKEIQSSDIDINPLFTNFIRQLVGQTFKQNKAGDSFFDENHFASLLKSKQVTNTSIISETVSQRAVET